MESIPENPGVILVADDDKGLLLSIKATLVSAGFPEPAMVSDSSRVLDLIRQHGFQLLLQDLIMPPVGGMDILKQLKEEFPETECVIITAVDEVGSAVQAMKYGAYDYLVKPIDKERLLIVIDRALERYHLRKERIFRKTEASFQELKRPEAFSDMIAEDPAMAKVFRYAEICAANDYNVLITGETGTGKGLLARALHRLSPRSEKTFMAVNMAAFSKNLIEDDLFGHQKGAFTGALRNKKGFFEAAQGGTLFLDEISELSMEVQAALLHVLEEKELYRLGSTEVRHVDTRIMAATNRNITEEVHAGKFRADLFYRLTTCQIDIPPLRKRKGDILPLAHYFMKKHAAVTHKNISSIAPELAERLMAYSFPGNVRELENIIASACLVEQSRILTLASIRPVKLEDLGDEQDDARLVSLSEVESAHIRQVLDAVGGNRTRAAQILEIGVRTLQRRLQTLPMESVPPDPTGTP
jgi:DNA-binding NtrC family response regulator